MGGHDDMALVILLWEMDDCVWSFLTGVWVLAILFWETGWFLSFLTRGGGNERGVWCVGACGERRKGGCGLPVLVYPDLGYG